MQTYQRPETLRVSVPRADVQGDCPECGSADLKAYPVLSEGGWWDVVKCQNCLCSVERKAGPLLGGITMLVEAV
jgi:hypothetical protein